MKTDYVRPQIETVPASRILESLGPVSCGSGNHDQTIGGPSSLWNSGTHRLSQN